MLVTTYAGDKSRCSVLRSLQAANDDISDTVQRSITVAKWLVTKAWTSVRIASSDTVNICKSYSKKISGTFFSGHGVYSTTKTEDTERLGRPLRAKPSKLKT